MEHLLVGATTPASSKSTGGTATLATLSTARRTLESFKKGNKQSVGNALSEPFNANATNSGILADPTGGGAKFSTDAPSIKPSFLFLSKLGGTVLVETPAKLSFRRYVANSILWFATFHFFARWTDWEGVAQNTLAATAPRTIESFQKGNKHPVGKVLLEERSKDTANTLVKPDKLLETAEAEAMSCTAAKVAKTKAPFWMDEVTFWMVMVVMMVVMMVAIATAFVILANVPEPTPAPVPATVQATAGNGVPAIVHANLTWITRHWNTRITTEFTDSREQYDSLGQLLGPTFKRDSPGSRDQCDSLGPLLGPTSRRDSPGSRDQCDSLVPILGPTPGRDSPDLRYHLDLLGRLLGPTSRRDLCWWYHIDVAQDAWNQKKDEKDKVNKNKNETASEATMTTDTPSSSHLELASVTQINNESDSSDDDDELIDSSVFGELSPSWILWCGLIEGFVCSLPSQTILQICDIYFGMAIYTTVFVDLFPSVEREMAMFVDLFPSVEREMAMSSNQHDSSTYDPPPATHATTVNRSHLLLCTKWPPHLPANSHHLQ